MCDSTRMDALFFRIGVISAGSAVALGAFGAHGLRAMVTPEMLAVFETGVRYQMYHALALMAIGLSAARLQGRAVAAAAWLFVAGTVLFSGSLYVLTLTGTRWWGAVTPLGGVAFLAGWAALLTVRVSER
jgi:uncharacterized membrane protein YgdD (TMEM256/DUF423 family)